MNTDSLAPNQDLPTNPNGATSISDIAQADNAEAIDNTPANSEAYYEDSPEAVIEILPNTEDFPNEQTSDQSKIASISDKEEEVIGQERLNSFADEDESVNSDDKASNNETLEQMQQQPNLSNQVRSNQIISDYTLDYKKLFEKYNELDASHKQLLEKYTGQDEDLKSLNERLNKLEESTKLKFDGLIQDALKQDDLIWDEDSEECQKDIAKAKLWHSKTEALCTSVLTAISDCGDRINQCSELMEEIKRESPSLYNRLQDRYKSLELSKRMLERLREPIELLKKSTLPSEQLLRLQAQDLVDLLRSQNDEGEAKKILAKKVKETGDTRYKAIREWRDIAEKSQKQWINFIEKKLLPALDGITDGNPYALDLVAELMNGYKVQSCQEKLSSWLQTYKDLEDILLDALKSLDVTQMLVVRGQPVDYDRHEPIGTEPDANLPHESIKEITRNGYEYKLQDQDQSLILRSAQIIVVKNK